MNPYLLLSGDPFTILQDNSISDRLGPLGLPDMYLLVKKVGVWACVIAIMILGLVIMLGKSQQKAEAKESVKVKLVDIIIITGAIFILTLLRLVASKLAGY